MNPLNRELGIQVLELETNDINKDSIVTLKNVIKHVEGSGAFRVTLLDVIDATKAVCLETLYGPGKTTNWLSLGIKTVYIEINGVVHHVDTTLGNNFNFTITDGYNYKADIEIEDSVWINDSGRSLSFTVVGKYNRAINTIDSLELFNISLEKDDKDDFSNKETLNAELVGYDLLVVSLVN